MNGQADQGGNHDHGQGQVGDDRPRLEVAVDDVSPEPGLGHEERHDGEPEPDGEAVAAVPEDGAHAHGDGGPDRRRHEVAVAHLDDGVAVRRRDPAPVAAGPAGASLPRSGGAHEAAGCDRQERERGGDEGQPGQARHRRAETMGLVRPVTKQHPKTCLPPPEDARAWWGWDASGPR